MEAICSLKSLKRLEINATPAGEWRPEQLLELPHSLQSLTLLLPQREVVAYSLPEWLRRVASDPSVSGLKTLAIICFQSSVVRSTNLRDIAQSLASVTSLTLHGCNKLSDDDLLFTIKRCGNLQHLSLENVSISSNFYTAAAPHVPQLQSLRTNHPGRKAQNQAEYYAGLTTLVQACSKFEAFTHYLSGDTERGLHPQVPSSFIDAFLDSCASRLKKFEINGLSMSIESIRSVCMRASAIQQLVVPISAEELVRILDISPQERMDLT